MKRPPKNIVFLTLQTFAAPGGIQRVNRVLSYALESLGKKNNWDIAMQACYDHKDQLIPGYLSASRYWAFQGNKVRFMVSSCIRAAKSDLVILSHIHLFSIVPIIRMINPGCRIWLIAHGIEAWRPSGSRTRRIWKRIDKTICVSTYTRETILSRHQLEDSKCIVLNNALDPFLRIPTSFEKSEVLMERYRILPGQQVILSLTRIAATEHFKGYEQVIGVLESIQQQVPGVRYLLAGPYEEKEKERILELIRKRNLSDTVLITGYIPEEELSDLFLLADLFVMPSKKEGFGIVFIEAMAHGLPVICGNADGSVDTIRNDHMGTAVNPDDPEQLKSAILHRLNQPLTPNHRRDIQEQCLRHFNTENYLRSIEQLIEHET